MIFAIFLILALIFCIWIVGRSDRALDKHDWEAIERVFDPNNSD